MRAGRRDHLITIQVATTSRDAAGQPIETWTEFATVWAGRKDVRGVERFTGNQDQAVRTATYNMGWLGGLHERMQVVDAGTTYRIVGIADDRRQNWVELSVEALDPEVIA